MRRRPPSTTRTSDCQVGVWHMHVNMATRGRTKRRVSVHFVKFFGEQLFLVARRAHDKMAVLPGPIRRSPARLVQIGRLRPGIEPTPAAAPFNLLPC